MTGLPTVIVGGVPEHFNFAWHMAAERGLYEKHGVKMEWLNQKEGTGQMIKSINQKRKAKEGLADLIVALTEGLVSDIAKGFVDPLRKSSPNELRLISTYVESPLCWAISSGSSSSYQNIESLNGEVWGISRFTSGSHLMAIVLAHQRGWNLAELKFDAQGSFENLRAGVNSGKSAAFMWETFTTKPYHDSGEIRRIGEITTPWPCFMIAATVGTLQAKSKEVASVLAAVREACILFHKESSSMPGIIADTYQLKLDDAKMWYNQVHITASSSILHSGLARALSALKDGGVISVDNPCTPSDIIAPDFAVLEKVEIKNMKLYSRPELITRTYNELKARGWSQGDLDWKQLGQIDQKNHYHGTEAVDIAIRTCGIQPNSRVISLGSGLGGPARYIAGTTGASVLAIELQSDLSHVAEELTARCKLNPNVQHVAGDFLAVHHHLRLSSYSSIVSWLTVLHFADRKELFTASQELLTPGGTFYAEDFYKKDTFTADEIQVLREEVYCQELPSETEYRASLQSAGLEVEMFEDLTEDWTQYTIQRVQSMENDKESLTVLHGKEIYEGLLFFYTKVRDLFLGKHLGGVRVVAKKK